MNLVNPEIARTANNLCDRFQNATPFPHLVIDNFLVEDFANKLLETFPVFDTTLATDETGKAGLKCVHENVRSLGNAYCDLDELISGNGFRDLVATMTGIPALIHDPNYYGGGTHENQSGQDLDLHIDFNYHPVTNDHRRLNLILFLNKQWQETWGGALQLCENPTRPKENLVSVLPQFNRAVIFATTERSWHGFTRIESPGSQRLSRKSFALYYYTRNRPESETARHHSTVYVERPLPESIAPGKSLTDSEYQDIQRLIARRDQHINRLYNDIEGLMSELEIHKRSWLMRQARRVVNLAARIKKLFS